MLLDPVKWISKRDTSPKVLLFNTRIMYAFNMCAEFQEYGFKLYKDRTIKDLDSVNRLICFHRVDEDHTGLNLTTETFHKDYQLTPLI